jgi:hypothetical protein
MGKLVFLYDSNFFHHPGKFQIHWLGPYVIRFVSETSVVQLEKLNGEIMEGLVNGVGEISIFDTLVQWELTD